MNGSYNDLASSDAAEISEMSSCETTSPILKLTLSPYIFQLYTIGHALFFFTVSDAQMTFSVQFHRLLYTKIIIKLRH